jgi:5'-nucleotidase
VRILAAALTALALLVGLASVRSHAQPRPGEVTISIVGTNDVHGGIAAEDGRGGLALFGGYLRNLRAARARDRGAVLLIDAGDMWQGTIESNLVEGAVVVAAYNALGYAAAAVGNHELDFGPEGPAAVAATAEQDPRGALKARAAEARFPFLAANLIDLRTNRPVSWPNVGASFSTEAAGIKVGIVGVMTAGALRQTIAANARGLRVDPLAPAIEAEARRLRSAGAVLVVAAAHAGGRCTAFADSRNVASCDQSSEIFEVARRLPRGVVDVIVAGHTHAGIAHEVAGIPIIEAFSGGRAFGRVDLAVDRTSGRVHRRRVFPPQDICARAKASSSRCDADAPIARYEGAAVTADPAIERLLDPGLKAAASLKTRPVGVVVDQRFRRGSDALASPLGQLFADAMRETMRADAAVVNTNGGLRADFPPGQLLFGNLYRVMPFDNRLVSLTVRTADLARVLAAELRRRSPRISFSGPRVDARCQDGGLRVSLVGAAGRIRDDATLTLATSDFVALGGDGILAAITPRGGFTLPDDGPLVREAVHDWLRARGGRLREAEFLARAESLLRLPAPPPLTCAQ